MGLYYAGIAANNLPPGVSFREGFRRSISAMMALRGSTNNMAADNDGRCGVTRRDEHHLGSSPGGRRRQDDATLGDFEDVADGGTFLAMRALYNFPNIVS